MAKLDQIQQFIDPLADRRAGGAFLARQHAQAKGHVVGDGQVAEQGILLKHKADFALANVQVGDVLAVEKDLTLVGFFQPGDDAQQGGLARTGGAEQADQLAFLNIQIDVVQRGEIAETL